MSGFVAVRLLGEGVPDGRVRESVRELRARGLRVLGVRLEGYALVATALASSSAAAPSARHEWDRLTEGASVDTHLAVDPGTCDSTLSHSCADVLYLPRMEPLFRAEKSALTLLLRHRGCLLAAAAMPHGWSIAIRSGGRVGDPPSTHRIRLELCGPPSAPAHTLLPSCLHGWITTGRQLRGGEVTVPLF